MSSPFSSSNLNDNVTGLELLKQNSVFSIFYDSSNKWLYLDWYGHLTLGAVQESCLIIAQCFLSRPCTRILNDNTNVLSTTPDVGKWLATEYLPYIQLAGVEHMAWVHSASIDAQSCTDDALHDLVSPVVVIFNDIASAYSWLSTVKFKPPVPQTVAKRKIYRNQEELKNYVAALCMLYIH